MLNCYQHKANLFIDSTLSADARPAVNRLCVCVTPTVTLFLEEAYAWHFGYVH